MALDYELTSGIKYNNFEAIKLTYLLILAVNEGDEWPVNSAFGPSDPSPTAVTAAQNTRSKNSERPT